MALKVVLRRNTRKNNVNYQQNMYELAQFLNSIDDESPALVDESIEGR